MNARSGRKAAQELDTTNGKEGDVSHLTHGKGAHPLCPYVCSYGGLHCNLVIYLTFMHTLYKIMEMICASFSFEDWSEFGEKC